MAGFTCDWTTLRPSPLTAVSCSLDWLANRFDVRNLLAKIDGIDPWNRSMINAIRSNLFCACLSPLPLGAWPPRRGWGRVFDGRGSVDMLLR